MDQLQGIDTGWAHLGHFPPQPLITETAGNAKPDMDLFSTGRIYLHLSLEELKASPIILCYLFSEFPMHGASEARLRHLFHRHDSQDTEE